MKRPTCILAIFTLIELLLPSTATCYNFKDLPTFAKGFFKNPGNVGSPFPCSSSVGYELIKYARQYMSQHPSQPLNILEVGAGTGSITQIIAKILRPIDHLDALEISSDYCSMLRQKFKANKAITIHCTPFEEFKSDFSYDFIISTLPLNSFNHALLESTLEQFKKLVKPGGILSYVALAGVGYAKQYFLVGNAKKETAANMEMLKKFRKQYQIDSATVFASIPPIRVYHLKIDHNLQN